LIEQQNQIKILQNTLEVTAQSPSFNSTEKSKDNSVEKIEN
jgi:hypothetical protein